MNKKIVKVCIFDKMSTPSQVLGYNGDAILDNICIKCETNEDISGDYVLDATFIVDSEGLYKQIHDEGILKVQMDYGEEIFRISKIQKGTRDISVFARQITISETLDMWIEDIRPTNTSGASALNNLVTGSIGKKYITVHSNITKPSTAYFVRMNMYQAIHDCDQSFIKRWGGEVQRRCYNLTINDRIGSDRGVQIRSNKNLTGFEADTNIDNVVTRIRPIGFDGIETGTFVDSPLINKYSAIKTKEIKYEDVKVKGENNPNEGFDTLAEAQAELIKRAKLEFTEKHIDELRAEYRINFIYLEQTEEYKDYIQAERVYIGDTVHVYEEKHDINISVRAINKKYDVLRQRVIEIELSNLDIKQKTITTSDIIAELGSIINKTENNNVADIIQSMINSGIKDSYVIPRQNEIIVADSKDINTANSLIRINKNGLAFSKNGYYGDYDYGFTIDGVINASLITTGILSAIMIQNLDGSLQIDLSGTNGIMTKKNGKNAIELAGTRLKFYDWDGLGDAIGQIYSARIGGNDNKPGIAMAHAENAFSTIVYEKNGTFNSYVTFDNNMVTAYNTKSIPPTPIVFHKNINMNDSIIYNTQLKTTTSDNAIYARDDEVAMIFKDRYVLMNDNQTVMFFNDNTYMIQNDTGTHFSGPVTFHDTVTDQNGNIIVGGGTGGGGSGGSSGDWQNHMISASCFRFIKGMEGFAPRHYTDPGGYATIGYGVSKIGHPTLYAQLVSEEPISEERAAKVSYDLKNNNYGATILNACKSMGVSKQCQFDALVSLAYNAGSGSVTGSNTLTNAIKRNIDDEAYIRPIWESFKITSGGQVLEGLKILRRNQCNMFFNKSFEIRKIPLINSSGGISGTVTENNGDGWLPQDVTNAPKIENAYGTFSCPTYGRVSAGYPTYPSGGSHNGVDIANASGTPIYAMRGGTVSKAGLYTGGGMETYGNVVYIEHENGIQTRYAHNSSILVKVGDVVKEGQQISRMGTTGNSTGNHLHFECLKNGVRTHPAPNMKVGNVIDKFTP